MEHLIAVIKKSQENLFCMVKVAAQGMTHQVLYPEQMIIHLEKRIKQMP
jgi:hypothetical protein